MSTNNINTSKADAPNIVEIVSHKGNSSPTNWEIKKLLSANKRLEKEIEDRKLSEEKVRLLNLQLIENNETLKKTNEELDRFAYVASHDLLEPLRKISIFTDRFANKMGATPDEEVKTYLDKIIQSSHRMQSLVNGLLKLSRQKEENLYFEKTDLNQVLKEVLTDMEVDIENKHVQVTTTTLPSIDAIPILVRQLFQNLLSNSIKFSRQDCNPQINIRTEKIKQPTINGSFDFSKCNTYHQIHFSDNGIGVDAQYLDEIFVVFKRLHSQNEYQGSGIGLSICKKIVEKHNGYISAYSKLNEGSTFVVTLPEIN